MDDRRQHAERYQRHDNQRADAPAQHHRDQAGERGADDHRSHQRDRVEAAQIVGAGESDLGQPLVRHERLPMRGVGEQVFGGDVMRVEDHAPGDDMPA
jgi:hypothetical protein